MMTEQEILAEYQAIYAAANDPDKLERLGELRKEADQAQLLLHARLIDGRIALVAGQHDQALGLISLLLQESQLPPALKCWALISRGHAYRHKGETDKAIADFTAVVDDPAAQAEQKARARVGRGNAHGQKGETDKAIADYTAVIEDRSAPAKPKAKARIYRGFAYEQKGETDKAIVDCIAVIDDPTAPAEPKTRARLCRGIAYGEKGETDKAIADYTAVIDDPAATEDVRSYALLQKSSCQAKTPHKAAKALSELSVEIDERTREAFREALREGERRKEYFFETESRFSPDASFLLVLREWNSYTPAIPDKGEPARGGGYFIKHGKTGVVIDPGFDFIEIFHEAGGRLCDIDHIVITHAHNDHTAELEAILTLLYEFNDKHGHTAEKAKKVNLYLSQGAARKFSGILRLRGCPELGEVVTLNKGKGDDGPPQKVRLSEDLLLTVLPSYHDDIITQDCCVGLGAELKFADGIVRRLLFTSDTPTLPRHDNQKQVPIYETYPEPFRSPGTADLLVPHIGTIKEYELDQDLLKAPMQSDLSKRESGGQPPNHLNLRGTFLILHALRPKAAVVSEFGEEMKTIWIEAVQVIGKKLAEVLETNAFPVFAGDPVVIYDIRHGKFLCHETCEFEEPQKLYMDDTPEVKGGKVGPGRPYLFLKEHPHLSHTLAKERVAAFHRALDERTLPHFRQ